MKITSIKQQEKRKDRYSIFVDGKYSFSLGETALLDQKLTNSQELTADELKAYKELSSEDKAYGKALRYAALRPRSTWEMESYLRRKKIDEPIAQKIMSNLNEIELLSDVSFANSWVENRRLLKPISRRRLVQELKQKRVPDEIIEQTLADDDTDELLILRGLVAKKRQQTRYQNDDLKLMQYLARQGFNYTDIKSAIEES